MVYLHPQINPDLIHWGWLEIRWYGLAYLAGLALSYLWLRRMARRGMLRMPLEQLADLITWIAVGVIAGGRLGWWIFYHRGPMLHWYDPIATWQGGMSFHGGLAGVAIVLVLWSRYKGISFRNLSDCAALVVPVGLFFGRIANFINGELYGNVSHVPWAMVFPSPAGPEPRHPSQLYEAMLEGPVLLASVWAIRKWIRPREGIIGASFLVLYGFFRFSVEFTRQPDSQLGYLAWGWLTMGQVLSAVIFLIGAAMLWSVLGREKEKRGRRQTLRD